MRCERLQDSGPYVLGALSPLEREDYERHLAGCAECRREVADLADLPALLGRLDLATVQAVAAGDEDAVPPSDPLLPRVLERTVRQRRAERRRRRWQTAGAAVAAACLGALALFGIRTAMQPHLNDMRVTAAGSPVAASVAIDTDDEGTVVRMHCEYRETATQDERPWTLKLVAVPKSGSPEDVQTWTAGHDDEYDMIAHTHFKRSEIARIEVQDNATGATLLQYTVA